MNLGCFYTRLPDRIGAKVKGGQPVPTEWQCHVRRALHKGLDQPELPRPDVWLIDERGLYLMQAVVDAKHAIIERGLPWFERFAAYRELLRTLLEEREAMDVAWGFGNKPSPVRALLTAYTALALGERALAREQLEWLVERGSTLVTSAVRADLAQLRADAPVA